MAGEMAFRGTTVSWDSAGGSSYSALSRLIGMTPPPKKRGAAEITNTLSINEYREFFQGWKEGGEPKLRFLLHRTQYALLDAAFESSAAIPNWKFEPPLPPGDAVKSNWIFAAFIMDLSPPDMSVDGDALYECELTLKITGKPVFTAGS